MSDLIIKPSPGAGNKLIIQDQAGGAILTTADSGASLNNLTGTLSEITPGAAGKVVSSDGTNWVSTKASDALTTDLPPGTSGNVLKSNGTNWTSAASGTLLSMTVYTTGSGDYTVPAGCNKIHVHVTGAGGGGGGMGDGGGYNGNFINPMRGHATGSGGGAGGTAISVLAVIPATTIPYVIGDGGVNDDSGSNFTTDGTAGADSTFAHSGGTLTGGGGGGGDHATKYPNASSAYNHGGSPRGGTGGTSAGGQLNLKGTAGQGGTVHWEHSGGYPSHHPSSGQGGGSYWGGVGVPAHEAVPPSGYARHNGGTAADAEDGETGSGGCGGRVHYGQWGSDGGKGIIVIYEYA